MPEDDGSTTTRTRVLLVDDYAGFRQRMARLLQLQSDLAVVGEASDGNEAIVRVRELHPDVVLIDFRMSGLDGFTAARTITTEFPRVKVFMLTAFPGALDPDKVAKNGIAGLLIKDQPASEILAAIRKSVTR
jgi:DNA-binding NarL/FixJ family response regulator